GPRAPTRGAAPEQAGSTIVALDAAGSGSVTRGGAGALVVDADSGALFRLDDRLAVSARLAIAPGASQLVYDRAAARAYVVDRANDRIVVVDVADKALTRTAAWSTPAEPFGVALSPDRHQLLVTTIADHALVALDTATGAEQWRRELGREPRGVAIS